MIAIPWIYVPMASKLGLRPSNSLAMTAHFISWNDAIISYILLIPCLMLFLFQILQNFHLTFCEETPIISFIKAKCNFMKEKSKSQTVAERRWAVRTVLSKIEFRSGEGRGCNLSGSGRYPGNEAVTFTMRAVSLRKTQMIRLLGKVTVN